MATQKDIQDRDARIAQLEAQLAAADQPADQRVADLQAQLAAAQSDSAIRVAELEEQLARQEAEDAERAVIKLVRFKAPTGSIVRVDEETASTFGPGWGKVK